MRGKSLSLQQAVENRKANVDTTILKKTSIAHGALDATWLSPMAKDQTKFDNERVCLKDSFLSPSAHDSKELHCSDSSQSVSKSDLQTDTESDHETSYSPKAN